MPENFFYIDLESVKDDRIVNYNFIQRNNAPSRAQRLLIKNDILFSGVRPYQHNNAVFLFENGKYVASTGFIQIRYKFPFFLLGYFSNDRFSRAVNIRSTGSSYPAINSYDLSRIKIFVPSEEEQSDISKLIIVINKKINNLESKISTLKKYKKGLIKFLSKESAQFIKIKDIVDICDKTGLQSSNGKDIGKYVFFINSTNDEFKRTDTYTFDGEHLVLNTGGQAFTSYINGKFSAMSDCLILKPKRNAMSLYVWLKSNEEKINAIGFQGTGLKHLDQSWLFRQNITLSKFSEEILFNLMGATNILIEKQKIRLDILCSVKQYLLSNLFI